MGAGQAKDAADKQQDEKAKKEALGYYEALIAKLSKAFALASASDYAHEVRDEVGFFQAVKAALAKSNPKGKISKRDREFAVGQLIASAIADASIIDVLEAAGPNPRDFSAF